MKQQKVRLKIEILHLLKVSLLSQTTSPAGDQAFKYINLW